MHKSGTDHPPAGLPGVGPETPNDTAFITEDMSKQMYFSTTILAKGTSVLSGYS